MESKQRLVPRALPIHTHCAPLAVSARGLGAFFAWTAFYYNRCRPSDSRPVVHLSIHLADVRQRELGAAIPYTLQPSWEVLDLPRPSESGPHNSAPPSVALSLDWHQAILLQIRKPLGMKTMTVRFLWSCSSTRTVRCVLGISVCLMGK